jgi:hypothetical protein
VWQPVETFEFAFDRDDVRREVIKIYIYDYDARNRAALIGNLRVPLARLEGQADRFVGETEGCMERAEAHDSRRSSTTSR